MESTLLCGYTNKQEADINTSLFRYNQVFCPKGRKLERESGVKILFAPIELYSALDENFSVSLKFESASDERNHEHASVCSLHTHAKFKLDTTI